MTDSRSKQGNVPDESETSLYSGEKGSYQRLVWHATGLRIQLEETSNE